MLENILAHRGVPGKYIKAVKSFLQASKGRVRLGTVFSEEFSVAWSETGGRIVSFTVPPSAEKSGSGKCNNRTLI